MKIKYGFISLVIFFLVVAQASFASKSSSEPETKLWKSRLALGMENLLKTQSPNGSWQAQITLSSAAYSADLILLYEYLGITSEKKQIVNQLMSQIWTDVNEDGGFPAYPGGVSNADVSISVYLATRITEEPEDSPRLVSLAKWINTHGGLKGAKAARIYLMVFGIDTTSNCIGGGVESFILHTKNKIPVVLRDMLLPVIHIVSSGFTHSLPAEKAPRALGLMGVCRKIHLPKWMKSSEKVKQKFYTWLENEINEDGILFEFSVVTLPALMALSKSTLPAHQKLLQKGVNTLETEFIQTTPKGLKLVLTDGTIAETAFFLQAAVDSGLFRNALSAAAASEAFLYRSQTPELRGWGFSRNNTRHPDSDVSTFVLRSLKSFGEATAQDRNLHAGVQAEALSWILSLQNSDGGFATFDKKKPTLISKLAGGKSGGSDGFSMTGSNAETTSRMAVLLREYLAVPKAENENLKPRYRKAIQWLLKKQNPNGSYPSVWFINYLFGTASSLAALGGAVGFQELDSSALTVAIEKGLKFIIEKQAADGGFSESPESFRQNRYIPLEKSSAVQTSLIVNELLTFLRAENYAHWSLLDPVLSRAVHFLMETQKSNGLWEDDTVFATLFPGYEYVNYSIIRKLAPLGAVGFYLETRERLSK